MDDSVLLSKLEYFVNVKYLLVDSLLELLTINIMNSVSLHGCDINCATKQKPITSNQRVVITKRLGYMYV